MNLEQNSIAFLKEVYNEVGYDTNISINIIEVAKRIKITDVSTIQTIVKNLEQKNYLQVAWVFGITETSICITALGINEAEA